MIKLFRRIRQRLLVDNKITKYLTYALGEIILVVLGIIIALQLNIAYTNSKVNKTTNQYLVQLSQELEGNNRFIKIYIENAKEDISRVNKYLEEINTLMPSEVQDTLLSKMIAWLGPTRWTNLANSSFKDFNSSGYINEIGDDELKRNVIKLESIYNHFLFSKQELTESWDKQLLPYYLKHADLMEMRDSIYTEKLPVNYIPIDKSAFVNNQEFNNLLVNRMMLSMRSLQRLEFIESHYTDLDSLINFYLEQQD